MPKEANTHKFDQIEIETYSRRLRVLLGIDREWHFNIIHVIENGLSRVLPEFSLHVLVASEIHGADAVSEFEPCRILVRDDIYAAAYRDEARSRFTLAHELGHLVLHWGNPRTRLPPIADERVSKSPVVSRLEQEANQFAGAFLMPAHLALQVDQPHKLARRCHVSELAATKRLNNLWVHEGRVNPIRVRRLFGTTDVK